MTAVRWINVGERREAYQGDRLVGWCLPEGGRWSLYVCREGLGWGAGEQIAANSETEAKAIVEDRAAGGAR